MVEQTCDSQFGYLMERLRAGDADAASALYDEFERPIRHALKRRITLSMRSRVGVSDVAQAVWMSFFADLDAIGRLNSPESLRGYLLRVAYNKLVDEVRHWDAAKRSEDKTMKIDSVTDGDVPQPNASTPSEIVGGKEFLQNLLTGLTDRQREICELRLQGFRVRDIAARFDLDERTIRRCLEKIEQRVAR